MPEFKVKSKTVMTQPPPPPKRQRVQKIIDAILDLDGVLEMLQDGECLLNGEWTGPNGKEIAKIEEEIAALKRKLAIIAAQD